MANTHVIRAPGGLLIPVVTADPSSPANGTMWYNSTDNVFRRRENGVTTTFGTSTLAATAVSYDNTSSGLTAVNVQTAIDELQSTKAADNAVIKKNGTVAFTGNQSMGGFRLTNLLDPTSAQDASTKAYVDAVALGLKPKKAVRAASAGANIALASALVNGLVLDGVTLATGDRVLVKDQTDPAENGIYDVAASGAASRSSDFDSLTPIDEINGAWVAVQEGTANAGKTYVQYGTVVTLGTSAINFQFYNPVASLIGGDMITMTGSTISVDLASTSGLESTNPGNAAGQLRIKVDATGGANLAKAASISANGLAIKVDDSTIEGDASTGQIRVKDGGISNAKVASGIDAVKIGDGSVSNAEFQRLDGVTSSIQTQLDGKKDASFSSSTLTASQTSAVASAFTFATASFEGAMIEYKIKEASTNRVRTGTVYIATDGTNTSFSDTFTETGDVGVVWDLNINGANLEVRYTTTANNKTMKAWMTKYSA